MAVAVTSYLFERGRHKPGRKLVRIDEFRGRIEDPDYIDGAIEIVVDGSVVLTSELWDLVDQLWVYLLDALEEHIRTGNRAQRFFPDQPSSFVFCKGRLPSTLRITVDYGSEAVPLQSGEAPIAEVVKSLLWGGGRFFTAMQRIAPSNGGHYTSCLERIRAISCLSLPR